MPKAGLSEGPIEIWGGVECTVNRVGEEYFDQIQTSGHILRDGDIDRIASLGAKACRYPALWEHVAPEHPEKLNFSWLDRRLGALKDRGVLPIAGLVHHGSGPRYTSLEDPNFPHLLADYARAVAERYPWLEDYTPVNEPLTTARFSGLYGLWYPHGRSSQTFLECLLNECKGTALAMKAIREINPTARLIQTEDLGKVHSVRKLAYQRDFENERRWLTWDLLCGTVTEGHPLWKFLIRQGIEEAELRWFSENPCPPDVLGINYYVTSERFLDDDAEQYPLENIGGNGRHRYADIEAVRVKREGIMGHKGILLEAWGRYHLPIAITEAHLGCTREEQQRWLLAAWRGAHQAKDRGADVRAVTVWSLFGAYNWSCLLTSNEGCYEPGVFDLRAPEPRETALAPLIRALAKGENPSDDLIDQPGWWEREVRFQYIPQGSSTRIEELNRSAAPILITGGGGRLARALVRTCELRGLPWMSVNRQELDIGKGSMVCDLLSEVKPWAVINAAGYENLPSAESEIDQCMWDNAKGPAALADTCADLDIPLITFSTDQVFDGAKNEPYIEEDHTSPLSVYGRSKAIAERIVSGRHRRALIIRTAALFSPWEHSKFIETVVSASRSQMPLEVDNSVCYSPTYVPDMVNAALDLLLDGATGIFHLTNQGCVTGREFAMRIARLSGASAALIRAREQEPTRIARPGYSVLASSRAWIMPDLEDALERCIQRAAVAPARCAYVS